MKALKGISWGLAGLSVLLGLVFLIVLGVNYGSSPVAIVSIVRSLLYLAWDTAVIVLMLIYVFAQKRAMGYIAVGMRLTTLTISFVQVLISQFQHVSVLPIMLWVITESLTFALWVLWLFAPRSKPMAVTVFVLAIVEILFEVLDVFRWIGFVDIIYILNSTERVCYFLSLALAALWLVLRKRETIPAGGEEAICVGVE